MLLAFLFFLPLSYAMDLNALNETPPASIALQELLELSTDQDSDKYHLHMMVDAEGKAKGMYNEPDRNNSNLGKQTARNVFWLDEFEKSSGALLLKKKGYDIIFIKGSIEELRQEGAFAIRFLSNGLSMQYKVCNFYISKDEKGWFVKNAYNGDRVSSIYFMTTWKGIDSVSGLCN